MSENAVQMSAAEKLLRTLRELSQPSDGASEMELMLGTVAMGMESQLGGVIQSSQQTGELDVFILQLTRWIAMHRSDDEKQLLVVELPRSATVRELPPGTRLHILDEAAEATLAAVNPLSK